MTTQKPPTATRTRVRRTAAAAIDDGDLDDGSTQKLLRSAMRAARKEMPPERDDEDRPRSFDDDPEPVIRERATRAATVPPAVTPPPVIGDTEVVAHRRAERRHWRSQTIIATSALLLALVAAAGSIATAYYASEAFVAAQNGTNAAGRAAFEAHRQADAAEQQIKLNADTLATIQRAYLAPQLPSRIAFPDPSRMAVIDFTNEGVSPAYNVRAAGHLALRPLADATPPASIGDNDMSKMDMTVYPRERKSIYIVNRALTEDETQKARSGNLLVMYYGVVQYDDIFKKHHQSRFCYTFLFADEVGLSTMNPACQAWNDSD